MAIPFLCQPYYVIFCQIKRLKQLIFRIIVGLLNQFIKFVISGSIEFVRNRLFGTNYIFAIVLGYITGMSTYVENTKE